MPVIIKLTLLNGEARYINAEKIVDITRWNDDKSTHIDYGEQARVLETPDEILVRIRKAIEEVGYVYNGWRREYE